MALSGFLAAMTGLSHGANMMIARIVPWKDYRTYVDVGTAQGDLAVQIADGVAVNSADDLINPPELCILERETKRVPHGRAIVIPYSDKTRGHGSHTVAPLWKDQLVDLLKGTEK